MLRPIAMARVSFTANLQRHVTAPAEQVPGTTVREVLDSVFSRNPRLRGYVLDEQGGLRRHVAVFVGGRQVADRERLGDPVAADADIYVMQALSGG